MAKNVILERRLLARALTKAQSAPELLPAIVNEAQETLRGNLRSAYVVGITGSAASGKSTLIDKIIKVLREDNLTVVVLAIDPTEEESGGAILADAVRMRDHYEDDGVFIRSFSTGGAHGAITKSLQEVITVASCFCDVVIVETAGAGQTDVVLRKHVNTFVVLLDSRGDAITLLKAGQHRYAHLLVVNARENMKMETEIFCASAEDFARSRLHRDGWKTQMFRVNARTGEGVSTLINEGAYAHRYFLKNKTQKKK